MRQLFLLASRSRWLREHLPRLGPFRRAVRRFMPGEEPEDALDAAERLGREGMGALLTLLGENVDTGAGAREVADHYREVLEGAERRGLDVHLSVKPTQLGMDLGREVAASNLDAILERAGALGREVWIDMESSRYVDGTLALFRRARERHGNVGVCLQAYLYRTPDDLESLLPLEPRLRLVKGAYSEPPDIAHPRRSEVDAAFLELGERLLDAAREGGAYPAFGTHDAALIDRLRAAAEARKLPPSAYEFEMLYGIRRDLQARLVREGQRMRILISYGSAWYPWYMRRLAERPANLLFLMKGLGPGASDAGPEATYGPGTGAPGTA